MDKINIVLATDKNYAQHATVAMTSILVNTKKPQDIVFFVIDDNIDLKNKKLMSETVFNLGGTINFVHTKEDSFEKVFVSGNITKAAYLRLCIPQILSSDIKKVIYLDCDLLVLDDIRKLWQIDLGDLPMGAVDDYGILSSSSKCQEKIINLDWQKEDSYFNSGVLLLNIQKWREERYYEKLIELVISRDFRHHDQDALNYIFKRNWKKLSMQWNVIPPVFNMTLRIVFNKNLLKTAVEAVKNISIMHYAGGYKPWEYNIYQGFNDKYYKYLSLTEYRDVNMPQPNKNKKRHSISRQLWRLRWAKFIVNYFGK